MIEKQKQYVYWDKQKDEYFITYYKKLFETNEKYILIDTITRILKKYSSN